MMENWVMDEIFRSLRLAKKKENRRHKDIQVMMYYRRKISLALIQEFGGELSKLDLQKLLFLFTMLQKKRAYDFVPYKFGCYSFQANADLSTMVKYSQVEECAGKSPSWKVKDETNYISQLSKEDQKSISIVKNQFAEYETRALIAYIYRQFPYYAINSEIANSMLNENELQKVEKTRPHSDETALYTIGYEGISFEEFLNRLIKHDIKLLIDVRKNSFSMKFGFSKKQLKRGCEGLGIDFMHLPELGINSESRKKLNSQADFDQLFSEYCSTTLVTERRFIELIAGMVDKHQRVAITCFEANIDQCHRKHLASEVSSLPNWKHQVKHICNEPGKNSDCGENLSHALW
jgi:uncharacterized protein (DUF488 family)